MAHSLFHPVLSFVIYDKGTALVKIIVMSYDRRPILLSPMDLIYERSGDLAAAEL